MAAPDDIDPSRRPRNEPGGSLDAGRDGSPPRYPPPDPSSPSIRYPPPPFTPRRVRLGPDTVLLEDPSAPPANRSDAWTWLVLAVGGFIVGQIVALILLSVVAGALGQSHNLTRIGNEAVPPEWYVVSSLFGLWSGFFGAPWLASRIRGTRRLRADLGLSFKWSDLWGIAIGVGGQFLVGFLYLPFHKYIHNFGAPTKKLTGGSHGTGFIVIAVLTVIAAPFMEELFFRGLLFRGLLRLFSPTDGRKAGVAAVAGAVVLDGALFGIAHGELLQFAGLAVFGAILAYVSYRTARLGMNMVSHGSFNLVATLSILSQNHWHL